MKRKTVILCIWLANGNTLTDAQGRSFTWDFENRLIQAVVPGTNGGTTTFKYDPFGRRIQKLGPLGTTNYIYDDANIVEEMDNTGSVLARYAQGPGVDQPLSEFRSGAASYYDADGIILEGRGASAGNSHRTNATSGTYRLPSEPIISACGLCWWGVSM